MKTVLIIILIHFSITLYAKFSTEQFERTSVNQNEDIIQLYISGQYTKVINFLESKNPETLAASDYYYLGMSYSQSKDLKKALSAMSNAVKLDSLNDGWRLNYARLLNQYGKTNESVRQYEQLISHDSLNGAAQYDLGIIYVNKKEFHPAKKIFSKICEQNKEDFLSAYYLALAKIETAETQSDSLDASKSIANAIRLNLEYTPSFELAAAYSLANNNYMPAFAYYSRLTELNATNGEYFYRAGFCFEKVKNYYGSIGLFKKAIKRDSTVANYFSHLGYAHFMVEEYDSALAAYKKAAELTPANPLSYLNLGFVYAKIDSVEAAKDSFEKALLNYPIAQIISAFEELITLNYMQKKFDEVQKIAEKVFTLNPQNAKSLFYLACTYDESGKTDKAVQHYRKALTAISRDPLYQKEVEHAVKRIQELTEKEKKFWKGKVNGQ
ncbi:MAG: tetratricopeptide repeat protein [Ignavibacteriales bacterium]|nr:tetratricopeptide repeat protein [Ignavibacteriales bacterium]